MPRYIVCRECESSDCCGCNIYTLARALVQGKLDWIKDEKNSIQIPTVSPDEVRGVLPLKVRNAYIHIDMYNSDGKLEMHGTLRAVQDALCVGLIQLAKEGEAHRKMVRKVCQIVLLQTEVCE